MANYSLQVDSTFKPFTYAELLAPVKESTKAHQKVEEQYSLLASQAETLKARAEKEKINNPDSKWLNKYEQYINKLEKAAADLATYGLNPNVRQDLFTVKKDYFSTVDPVIKAITQQQKLSDTQYAQNPALRMVYGDMPTIDALIGDMTLKPTAYSGTDIYTQAATSSKAASARNIINTFSNDPQFAGYIRQTKQKGYQFKDIQDMLSNPTFANLVDTVVAQFGGDVRVDSAGNKVVTFNGLNEQGNKRLKGEILKGLIDGVIFEQDKQLQYNQYAAQQRQFQHDKDMLTLKNELEKQTAAAAAAEAEAAAASAQQQILMAQVDPVSQLTHAALRSKYGNAYVDGEGNQSTLNITGSQLKDYNKRIKDAVAQLNNDSSRMERGVPWITIQDMIDYLGDRKIDPKKERYMRPIKGQLMEEGLSQYADLIIELQERKKIAGYNTTDNSNPNMVKFYDNGLPLEQPGRINNTLRGAGGGNKTITEHTGWRYSIAPSDEKKAHNVILSDLGPSQNNFTIVNYTSDGWQSVGTLSKDEFKDATVLNYQAYPKGTVVEVEKDNGETVYIKLPKSKTTEKLDKIFGNLSTYNKIYGKTKDEIKKMGDILTAAGINDIYSTIADSYRSNTSETQEFEDHGTVIE